MAQSTPRSRIDGLQQHTSTTYIVRGPKGGRGIEAAPLLTCRQSLGVSSSNNINLDGLPERSTPVHYLKLARQVVGLAVMSQTTKGRMGIVLKAEQPFFLERLGQ